MAEWSDEILLCAIEKPATPFRHWDTKHLKPHSFELNRLDFQRSRDLIQVSCWEAGGEGQLRFHTRFSGLLAALAKEPSHRAAGEWLAVSTSPHNDTRSQHDWHRHISLVMLAFAIMSVIRHHANAALPPKRSRRGRH